MFDRMLVTVEVHEEPTIHTVMVEHLKRWIKSHGAITAKTDGRVNLFSRRHKSFNHQYPHLVEVLGELPAGTVVVDSVGPFNRWPHGRVRPNALPGRSSEHLRTRQATCCRVVCITRVG